MQLAEEQLNKFTYTPQGLYSAPSELHALALYVLQAVRLRSAGWENLRTTVRLWSKSLQIQNFKNIPDQFKPYADIFIIESVLKNSLQKAESKPLRNRLYQFVLQLVLRHKLKAYDFNEETPRAIEALAWEGFSLPLLEEHFGDKVRLVKRKSGVQVLIDEQKAKSTTIRIWDTQDGQRIYNESETKLEPVPPLPHFELRQFSSDKLKEKSREKIARLQEFKLSTHPDARDRKLVQQTGKCRGMRAFDQRYTNQSALIEGPQCRMERPGTNRLLRERKQSGERNSFSRDKENLMGKRFQPYYRKNYYH